MGKYQTDAKIVWNQQNTRRQGNSSSTLFHLCDRNSEKQVTYQPPINPPITPLPQPPHPHPTQPRNPQPKPSHSPKNPPRTQTTSPPPPLTKSHSEKFSTFRKEKPPGQEEHYRETATRTHLQYSRSQKENGGFRYLPIHHSPPHLLSKPTPPHPKKPPVKDPKTQNQRKMPPIRIFRGERGKLGDGYYKGNVKERKGIEEEENRREER